MSIQEPYTNNHTHLQSLVDLHHAQYLKTPVTYFAETHTVTLEGIAHAMCHGPRIKLKTRAALRPRDVLFGCQRSALTHKHAVLET